MVNLCLKCPDDLRGKCCHYAYSAYTYDGKYHNIFLENQYCPLYDPKSKKCKSYKERFLINPYCRKIIPAVENGALVERCAYLKKYKKKIRVPPKRFTIPENIRLCDKKMIEYLNSISQEQFIRTFYPELLRVII